MSMTKLISETRELNIDDLATVVGGDTPFYGMNCSVNQGAAIKGIGDALGNVPIIGGLLQAGVTVAGWIICA